MEDINKTQDPYNPSTDQPNPLQPLQSTQTGQPINQTEQSITCQKPNSFHDYLQQQINGDTPLSETHNQHEYMPNLHRNFNPPPKNMFLVLIIVLFVIITVSVSVYSYRAHILNSFAKMSKSPAEYYAYIEKKAILDMIDQLQPTLGSIDNTDAIHLKTEISFDRNSIDSLLQSSTDINLQELESKLGTHIDNFHLNTTLKTFDFINRYSNLIVDHLSQVELDNNSTFELNSFTTKCTKLTVTLTNDDAYFILNALFKEARQDDYIINLLPMYKVTEREYQNVIDDALSQLQKNSDHLLPGDLHMEVYVDSAGRIIGREITMKHSDATFHYTLLSKNGYEEYTLYAQDMKGNSLFDINGNHRKKNGSYYGEASIDLYDPSDTYFDDIRINLDYEDIRIQYINNRAYQLGTYSFSSADLMGLSLTSEFTVKNDLQNNKTILTMGSTKLITAESSMEYVK